MLLVLSAADDAHVPLVASRLESRGTPYLWFDPGSFPQEALISFCIGADRTLSGTLRMRGSDLDLRDVTAVWDRRPSIPLPSDEIDSVSVRSYVEHASRHFLEGIWGTLDCLWVPAKPVISRAAHNKLKQLVTASTLGFSVPETAITNSPSTFVDFYSSAGPSLISKSLVNHPVEVGGRYYPAMYTRPVYRRDVFRYRSIRYSPCIFQKYVDKRVEVRATIVGDRVLAAEIHSQDSRTTLHDWRHYHDSRVDYRPHVLPEELETRLLLLAQALGLSYGAVDLVLTPSGDYVFLEINPNGQWAFIEQLAGLPIADALTDLLQSEER